MAVAAALAAPVAGFAQSSVTIRGLFKGGFEVSSLHNYTRAGNASQSGIADDSSRLIFNVVEDLGGGLQAIGQYDLRLKLDDLQNTTPTSNPGSLASGNTHVGLRSKTWGRIFIGRQDLHYFNRESDLINRGSLRADSISILAFAGAGATPVAVSSANNRTQNVVHYTTPNWGGFTAIVAYSSNPSATDADQLSLVRKGRAWNINPNLERANWQAGYSYWSARPDGLLVNEQRGDRLYGSYTWGGLKAGLAWDKSRVRTGGADFSRRQAWSLPVSYAWGPHSIHAHYTRAGDDKVIAGDNRARMLAVAYAYDLSKRTSAAITYARIDNSAAAAYNFYSGTTLGLSAVPAAGEDPRLWALTLRHQF